MKKENKFLITVVSAILVSALILVFCMQVLSKSNGDKKDYDMNIISEIVAESTPEDMNKEPPVAQNELKQKFAQMSKVSEDGRSITVISEEYLDDYWSDGKTKNKVLTSEEVFYIIQDSIRIYLNYDSITVYSNQTLESMHGNLIACYPLMNGTLTEFPLYKQAIDANYVAACQSIHALIVYRLAALSSPDAFITGLDAPYEEGGGFSGEQLDTALFYIPKHVNDTLTRDEWVEIILSDGAVPEHLPWLQYFNISAYGSSVIEHFAIDRAHVRVFPTAEMERSQANNVVDIIDRTKDANTPAEPFWEDDKFVYYFPCAQSESVFALMYDGREVLLIDALTLGYITPDEFDKFDFSYYRTVKRDTNQENTSTPYTPYFNATAVYTDKKRDDGIYPYSNFVPDTATLTKYFNDIIQNDVYVIDKGTPEIPSFTEMFNSYDEAWFESNSLILAVIESDSGVLPKVSSIIVDGSTIEVYFEPESLGKKQNQVYTVFIETNRINIENIEIITDKHPYSDHPLYKKYPEYFGLDGMKGVEVYVWQIEDGGYRCGALTGTNRLKTDEEIQALFDNGATIPEMRTILELCEVDKDHISLIPIIPISDPLADNCYKVDVTEESFLKAQTLFWGE